VALTLALLASACGGSDSSTPTTPSTPTYSLTGTVSGVSGNGAAANLAGATVTISDGADSGKTATTDSTGNYSFPSLKQGGFTVVASATNYTSQSKPVTLTSNQTLSFQLSLATGPVRFQIDQATCGSAQSNPVVDIFVDVPVTKPPTLTLYNGSSHSSGTLNITVGNHTLQVQGGGRTNNFGPVPMVVTTAGLNYVLTCH